ncbi:MAG: peptidoglycan-associated lipoprotein Pal [Rhizomicrobium sp.]|jgi:peptidoglycan-associated lipoprotein
MRHSSKVHLPAFVCAAIALAGCASKPPPAAQNTQPAAAAATPVAPVGSSILPGSAKDFQVNVGDTVHFDYMRADIGDEARSILQRQAAWLNKYPAVKVTIEGHCDERGTRAYNLALGAKRAEAVKEYLASIGVAVARVGTISYGKERPVCVESDETCWAKNRRGVTTLSAGAAS